MSARRGILPVAVAQINSTVGDLEGNSARIREMADRAREEGAALVVFPELTLTGYLPEDLLLKRRFLEAARGALEELAGQIREIVALVGFPERAEAVYNSAAVLADGRVAGVYRKMRLPNYGVFDEKRYFAEGHQPALIELNDVSVGITVCEDMWEEGAPASAEALAGAEVLVNLSASPYHAGKGREREEMFARRARDNHAAVVFCNLVGGQDELVFDGHSLVIDASGELVARAPQFDEALVVCALETTGGEHRRHPGPAVTLACLEVDRERESAPCPIAELMEPEEEVYAALVTGLRDYVRKNGFEHVVFGISGGIDSALVALIAADALGPEHVTAVAMPSPYSSEGARRDARTIAENLGIELVELPIEDAMQSYDRMLSPVFDGAEPDITEENLQARIRGNLVMALSNKFGWLVLTTGNKSEMSVGYATLYGDMAGGFAVLKDVFKGWVYRLVRWRNEREGRELVPAAVLERAPSAELRYEQRDDESLPPYEVLDAILAGYIEQDRDAGELVESGLPAHEVERVIRMVDHAEYKRRQAPPGIRISPKAFGRDRRLPITNRFSS